MFLNTLLALLLLLAVIISLYLYWFYETVFPFFEKRNIPYIKPTPIFGNIIKVILKNKTSFEIQTDIYRKFESHKIAGYFKFHKPIYLIRDLELIKNVLLKDFDHFTARFSSQVANGNLPAKSLVAVHGEEWRNQRTKFSSSFSSGKQKRMFPLVKACGNNLAQVLEQFAPEEDIEFEGLCRRFANDVIFSCAFGMTTNTLENSKLIEKISKNNWLRFLFRAFVILPSRMAKIIGPYVLDNKIERSFSSLIIEAITYRETNNIARNDFLDTLIKLKKDSKLNKFQVELDTKKLKNCIEITDKDLVVQAFLFYIAGTKTTTSILSLSIMELAFKPELQEKVRNEITTILENNGNELTFEVMQQMKYTDMVIAETLRKHPHGASLHRVCTIDYNVPGTNIVIKKNDDILVPVFALHMDEKYYEKPNEFYPEHFTEEAIAGRPHFTYLPFGAGPRMCIAFRFAKMSLKVGLIYMLKNFSYSISPKMKLTASYKYETNLVDLLELKDGIWLKSKKL